MVTTYRSLKDTITFTPLRFKLGEATGKGTSVVRVPFELLDTLHDESLYPFTFAIAYDKSCVSHVSMDIPSSSLLSGVPYAITPIPEGIMVEFKERRTVNGAGHLADFLFMLGDPERLDTTICTLDVKNWMFERGCYYSDIEDGGLHILSRLPKMECSMTTVKSVEWMRTTGDYYPQPFPVTLHVENIGDREVRGARYRIAFDTTKIELVQPTTMIQPGYPPVIDTGKTYSARWLVRAKKQITDDSTRIRIIASFENHDDVECSSFVRIPATGPIPVGELESPTQFTWSKPRLDYQQNPFAVRAEVTNEGGKELEGVRFRIEYDANDFQLLSGLETLNGGPFSIGHGKVSEAKWEMRARPRATSDSVTLRSVVTFANADSIVLLRRVWIERADADVICSVDDPGIGTDTLSVRYVPSPIPITMRVENIGGMRSDTMFARITLPAELTLVAGASVQRTTPPVLDPNQTGRVTWLIDHPQGIGGRYTVEVLTYDGGDTARCSVPFWLPALRTPALEATCTMIDTVQVDASGKFYLPFDVLVELRNTGQREAANVRARLKLPDGLALADTTEPLMKTLAAVLAPHRPFDPSLKAGWRLRVADLTTALRIKTVTIDVTAEDTIRNTTITETTTCAVLIPGMQSNFTCVSAKQLGNPDTLTRNANGTAIEPNAVVWRAGFVNDGTLPATVRTLRARVTNASIDPLTPPVQAINRQVQPGDTVFASWVLHFMNAEGQTNATVEMEMEDVSGLTVRCTENVVVPGVKGAVTCVLTVSDSLVRWNEVTRSYEPPIVTITATLRNAAFIDVNAISAQLSIINPPGLPIIDFNPIPPDNTNPKQLALLAPTQTGQVQWRVVVSPQNLAPSDTVIGFELVSTSATPLIAPVQCNAEVRVQSRRITSVEERAIPAAITLGQNYPNPFNPSTMIEYELPAPMQVRLAVFDVFGREVRELVNERRDAGLHRIPFDADGLPGGMYFYRLEAGGKILIRQMVIVK